MHSRVLGCSAAPGFPGRALRLCSTPRIESVKGCAFRASSWTSAAAKSRRAILFAVRPMRDVNVRAAVRRPLPRFPPHIRSSFSDFSLRSSRRLLRSAPTRSRPSPATARVGTTRRKAGSRSVALPACNLERRQPGGVTSRSPASWSAPTALVAGYGCEHGARPDLQSTRVVVSASDRSTKRTRHSAQVFIAGGTYDCFADATFVNLCSSSSGNYVFNVERRTPSPAQAAVERDRGRRRRLRRRRCKRSSWTTPRTCTYDAGDIPDATRERSVRSRARTSDGRHRRSSSVTKASFTTTCTATQESSAEDASRVCATAHGTSPDRAFSESRPGAPPCDVDPRALRFKDDERARSGPALVRFPETGARAQSRPDRGPVRRGDRASRCSSTGFGLARFFAWLVVRRRQGHARAGLATADRWAAHRSARACCAARSSLRCSASCTSSRPTSRRSTVGHAALPPLPRQLSDDDRVRGGGGGRSLRARLDARWLHSGQIFWGHGGDHGLVGGVGAGEREGAGAALLRLADLRARVLLAHDRVLRRERDLAGGSPKGVVAPFRRGRRGDAARRVTLRPSVART